MPLNNFKFKDSIKDEEINIDYLIKEFREFVEVCYDNPATLFQRKLESLFFFFYVPGDYTEADFREDMEEFCDRFEGVSYELVDQAPMSPSRQFFIKNTKLVYPSVKDFEILSKNKDKLKDAIRWFKQQLNAEPDLLNEDDQEDLVLIYNEQMEELREWKPVQVKLLISEETD